MKIYVIPVDQYYQKQPKFRAFPEHSINYNIEIDFINYLHNHDGLLTKDPKEADWHYLPLMWSFWQLTHDYARSGREELQQYLNEIIIDSEKTFTVSEADDLPTSFNVGKMLIFSANQNTSGEIPVPIMTLPHALPEKLPEKKYLSSFVGGIKPWKTRMRMLELVGNRPDVNIIQSKKGEQLFVNSILESYTTLCPRGSAMSSYRFYESMQLGVAPIMICESDFRPFPADIKWNSCSYFIDDVEKLPELLDSLNKKELLWKGANAKAVWHKKLGNQQWCNFVIKELGYMGRTDAEIESDSQSDLVHTKHREVFCELINRYGLKIGAELGVWFGWLSSKIMETTQVEYLYGVDHYSHETHAYAEASLPQKYLDKVYEHVYNKMRIWQSRYLLVRRFTKDAAMDVPSNLDFIFIDADHRYENVKEDLELWYPKVKKGGMVAGHDYHSDKHPGVTKAVDEFFKNQPVNEADANVWWTIKL